MEMSILFKGLILGISVAAPLGPIGLLCINRTLNKNFMSGVVSGMGATFADVFYGVIAGFGITFISNFFIDNKILFNVLGGFILLFMGWRTFRKKNQSFQRTKSVSIKFRKRNYVNDFLSTFVLTLSNPVTILFFTAVFATFGLSSPDVGLKSAGLLIFGVFLGSGIWWMFINGMANKFRYKISDTLIPRINMISGIVIMVFGVAILLNLVKILLV